MEIEDKIKELLQKNELDEAIKAIQSLGFVNQTVQDDIILISAQFEHLLEKIKQGTIATSEEIIESNKIRSKIFNLVKNAGGILVDNENEIIKEYLYHLAIKFQFYNNSFVDLRLIEFKSQFAKKQSYWFRELNREFTVEKNKSLGQCIIAGEYGSGKTRSIQELVKNISASQLSKEVNDFFIPFYIDLSVLQRKHREKEPLERLFYFIAEEWNKILLPSKYEVNYGYSEIINLIKKNKFFIAFDALNEVEEKYFEGIMTALNDFFKNFAGIGHQFVLLVRERSFSNYSFLKTFTGFSYLKVLPLNNQAITEFILKQLGIIPILKKKIILLAEENDSDLLQQLTNLEKNNYLTPIEDLKKIDTLLEYKLEFSEMRLKVKIALQLIQLINDKKKIQYIAQNPSDLDAIIEFFRLEGKLPESRTLIIEKAIISRLRTSGIKNLKTFSIADKSELRIKLKLSLLQKLAFHLFDSDRKSIIHQGKLTELAVPFLKTLNVKEVEELLHELTVEDNILKREGEHLSFVNQSFLEYFVAKEIYELWEQGKNPTKKQSIKKFFRTESLFPITAMMAGFLEEDELIFLMNQLNQNNRTKKLAALCVLNAKEINEKKNENLIKSMINDTTKKIKRAALIPEKIINQIISIIILLLFIYTQQFNNFFLSSRNIADIKLGISNSAIVNYLNESLLGIGLLLFLTSSFSIKFITKIGMPIKELQWLIALIVIPNLYLIISDVSENFYYLLFTISGASLLFLTIRLLLNIFIFPVGNIINKSIERLIIQKRIYPNLEILKVLGYYSRSKIEELKAFVKSKQFISEEVIHVFDQLSINSPQAYYQAMSSLEDPTYSAESIKVIEDTIIYIHLPETDIKAGIERIKSFLLNARNKKRDELNIESNLRAIDALSEIARHKQEYKNDITKYLENISKYSLVYDYRLRFKAWRDLNKKELKKTERPSIKSLEKLAVYFGVSSNFLYITIFLLVFAVFITLISL